MTSWTANLFCSFWKLLSKCWTNACSWTTYINRGRPHRHMRLVLYRNYSTTELGNNRRSLLWRHNERGGVSNHQPRDCLLNLLFRCGSEKTTSKLCVHGLCKRNSPVAGDFPAQRASNAENVSTWWRHHVHALTPSVIHQTSIELTHAMGE